jgi:hypothetical protein
MVPQPRLQKKKKREKNPKGAKHPSHIRVDNS